MTRAGETLRGTAILCSFLLAGCADGRAVRIMAGHSDTVIVNSREPVPLGLRLVNASGGTREARKVQLRRVSGGALELLGDATVKCNSAGDVVVSATRGELSSNFTVLCRPIAGFRMPRVMRLTVGGPPVPLEMGAIGLDRKPIEPVAGRLSVRDTQVVKVTEGVIYPASRGATAIEVEAGDCATFFLIEVVEPGRATTELLPHQYYAESLSVAAGELRSWHVPAGRYEISLFDDSGAPPFLELASYEMNCARIPRTEQQYSCVAKDRAAVIVHHTRPAGRGREAKATLLVKRRSDSTYDPAWRTSLGVYGCPFIG